MLQITPRSTPKTKNSLSHLDPYSLIEKSRKGVNWKTFSSYSKKSFLTDTEWAEILAITPRTLQRYKEDERTFDLRDSERILQVMQVIEKGREVFGDEKKFNRWLHSPIIALGGKMPREFFDTSTGLQYITDELGRIEYGVFA